MATRTWIAVGLVTAVAIVVGVVWSRDDAARPRPVRTRSLDANAFRSELAVRIARAKTLAARPAGERRPPPTPPAGRWPMLGRGAMVNAGTQLIEPQCTIGPRELCDVLEELVRRCDAGDARDYLAVGQYLADTPPRGIVAVTFFLQACRIGDPAGCERLDELKSPSPPDCARDPFACSYTALRTQDQELHAQACSLGAGDSCAHMAWFTRDDIERSRAYVEQACQLGLPMACAELAARLRPGCVEDEQRTCYEPDPVQARAALEIGCAAGWSDELDCADLD